MSELRVVICGGGIAAVEGLLHLRRLAGSSVGVKLIAPNEELVYRPMAVREPFAFGPARRYPLRRIARDNDAEWIKDSLAWVDPDARVVQHRDWRERAVRRTPRSGRWTARGAVQAGARDDIPRR